MKSEYRDFYITHYSQWWYKAENFIANQILMAGTYKELLRKIDQRFAKRP
jgi:hypothetical protein